VNGRYVQHGHASVHVEDRGYQFADGVYEYIAFYNRTLLDGEEHLKRLERSLGELEIGLPVSLKSMWIIARELIARNSREDGGLYIQVTRGVARRDHAFPKAIKPSLVMTVTHAKLPKLAEVEQGVKVISTRDTRWSRRDIKSVALLANVIAKQEAARQQTREAWLVDAEGMVSEGAVSNAYIVSREGVLITHPADRHILNGITRQVVLKLARKAGVEVVERPFSLNEAHNAAEAFITSTSANILPVVQLDDRRIGAGKPGPVTKKLLKLYLDHVKQQTRKQLDGAV
jgi:D-alanine transaminase